MTTLKMEEKLKEDLKQAQLMANELVVATIRLLLSEIRNAQIAKGEVLTDDEIIQVIQKELKKRRESAAVLQTYLPQQMSLEQLTKVVEEVINELGAREVKDMGRVISAVRAKVGSSAEGSAVSQIVKEKLTA
jgi:uncharacterized protein